MYDDSHHRLLSKAAFSAQRLTVLFAFIVMGSLLGLNGWQSWTARTEAYQVAETTQANLARSLAQHAEDTIEQADTELNGLIERIETDGLAANQVKRLHQVMLSDMKFLEQLHGLFLYDKDGKWVVTSGDLIPPNANNADREYFIYHKNNTDRGPHLGPVIHSRSNNELIIPLSRRINAPDGSFAGVVLATLRLDYFNQFYAGFDIDEHGVLFLALRDGTILTRRPFDPNVVGTNISRTRLFSELLMQSPSGSEMAVSIIDGIERMYGYKATIGYPMVAVAAQSKANIFATWRENLIHSALFVALVILAMGACAITLLRQIRRGQKTESELRNAHAALHKLAMQDGLTGLANRRQLDAALPDEMGRAHRSGRPLGVIMLDIDHFKRFNDLYGHPAGDECIRAVGQAVLSCVGRAGDLVVRYGGEELLVLLPESDEIGTWQVADRILQAVRDLQIYHAGNDIGVVTISAGTYVMDGTAPMMRVQALIKLADEALYKAKSQGRNRVWPTKALKSEPIPAL